jgi:hypothetical protein
MCHGIGWMLYLLSPHANHYERTIHAHYKGLGDYRVDVFLFPAMLPFDLLFGSIPREIKDGVSNAGLSGAIDSLNV